MDPQNSNKSKVLPLQLQEIFLLQTGSSYRQTSGRTIMDTCVPCDMHLMCSTATQCMTSSSRDHITLGQGIVLILCFTYHVALLHGSHITCYCVALVLHGSCRTGSQYQYSVYQQQNITTRNYKIEDSSSICTTSYKQVLDNYWLYARYSLLSLYMIYCKGKYKNFPNKKMIQKPNKRGVLTACRSFTK